MIFAFKRSLKFLTRYTVIFTNPQNTGAGKINISGKCHCLRCCRIYWASKAQRRGASSCVCLREIKCQHICRKCIGTAKL